MRLAPEGRKWRNFERKKKQEQKNKQKKKMKDWKANKKVDEKTKILIGNGMEKNILIVSMLLFQP